MQTYASSHRAHHQSVVPANDERKGNVVTTTYTCDACGHIETQALDLDAHEDIQPAIDEEYAEDRTKYCFDEKRVSEYIQTRAQMSHLSEWMNKREADEKDKDVQEMLAKIKMLNVAGLEALLRPSLESKSFIKLEFSDLDMSRKELIVKLTVQDSISDRDQRDALKTFQASMEPPLKETNWRLIKSSVNYELGFIIAQLKGYRSEESLKPVIQSESRSS